MSASVTDPYLRPVKPKPTLSSLRLTKDQRATLKLLEQRSKRGWMTSIKGSPGKNEVRKLTIDSLVKRHLVRTLPGFGTRPAQAMLTPLGRDIAGRVK